MALGNGKHNRRSYISASVTKRIRLRRRSTGETVSHVRYVVDYRDPHGKRRQFFFKSRQDALTYREQLFARVRRGTWDRGALSLSLSQILEHWLQETKPHVRPCTWRNYEKVLRYAMGPLPEGNAAERRRITLGRTEGPQAFVELLGNPPLHDLTTAQIRQWHATLAATVGRRTADEMKRCLAAALKLASEDFDLGVPAVPPSRAGGARGHERKSILRPAQVRQLLEIAAQDEDRGIYYAFPFLTGLRPSEQLGLLWKDVDFDSMTLEVVRTQAPDGTIQEATKSASSARTVPLPKQLQDMLIAWKRVCPPDIAGIGRVFPTIGRKYKSGATARAGLPLTYYNFRSHYWKPALVACRLPYVSPHSARHTYISTLQAVGVEVGLVAKLVGHSNPNITLAHYTHAVRGGAFAAHALQQAYFAALDSTDENGFEHLRQV